MEITGQHTVRHKDFTGLALEAAPDPETSGNFRTSSPLNTFE